MLKLTNDLIKKSLNKRNIPFTESGNHSEYGGGISLIEYDIKLYSESDRYIRIYGTNYGKVYTLKRMQYLGLKFYRTIPIEYLTKYKSHLPKWLTEGK